MFAFCASVRARIVQGAHKLMANRNCAILVSETENPLLRGSDIMIAVCMIHDNELQSPQQTISKLDNTSCTCTARTIGAMRDGEIRQ